MSDPGQRPRVIRTEDGYTFERQEDGSWSDGDMTFDSLADVVDGADFTVLEWEPDDTQ
jgi:hypothetical protein